MANVTRSSKRVFSLSNSKFLCAFSFVAIEKLTLTHHNLLIIATDSPKVLTMAIERTALENSNEKIYHRITLEEQVCIDGQNYELRGLVVHQGLNTRTGHYYAYVKDPMRVFSP